IYSEEKDLHYALAKKLDFKAQTRLWGYNVGRSSQEQELSRILVETPVQDDTKTSNDLSPIQAQRSWDRQAEDNVIDRLERIGLIAPRGEVDKALDTVINNLEVTNNIDFEPDVRWRVPIMADLKSTTPVDQKQNPQMIAALPIGGRVKMDSWNDKLELIKSKPVGTVAEREKMPFEVTPFMPYLMRYGAETSKPIAASAATTPADPKTGASAPGKP